MEREVCTGVEGEEGSREKGPAEIAPVLRRNYEENGRGWGSGLHGVGHVCWVGSVRVRKDSVASHLSFRHCY